MKWRAAGVQSFPRAKTRASRSRIVFFSFLPPYPGEKGTGPSGKPLHFKGSTFHRVINE